MFDFVKTNITQKIKTELLNNSLLHFRYDDVDENGVYDKQTAEYLPNFKFIIGAKYIKKDEIKIYTGDHYIKLNGSLHKYYNNGQHNYNNFTILNLVEVLSDWRFRTN